MSALESSLINLEGRSLRDLAELDDILGWALTRVAKEASGETEPLARFDAAV